MDNYLMNNESSANENTNIIPKIITVLWMMSYGTVAVCLLFNGLLNDYSFLPFIKNTSGLTPTEIVKLLFVINGSMIGACTMGMVSFHNYACMKDNFIIRHIWGYFLAPWLACFVSIIVYALLEIGLFTFSAETSSQPLEVKTVLALIVIGFLSGFGWYEAIKKITSITQKVFIRDSSKNDS